MGLLLWFASWPFWGTLKTLTTEQSLTLSACSRVIRVFRGKLFLTEPPQAERPTYLRNKEQQSHSACFRVIRGKLFLYEKHEDTKGTEGSPNRTIPLNWARSPRRFLNQQKTLISPTQVTRRAQCRRSPLCPSCLRV
jgi:hypothetical protein